MDAEENPSLRNQKSAVSRTTILFGVLVCIAGLMLAALFVRNRQRLHSSPFALRQPGIVQRLEESRSGSPEIDRSLLGKVQVVTNSDRVEVRSPYYPPSDLPVYPFSVHHMKASEELVIGEGKVQLSYIGVAYASITNGNLLNDREIPGQFFGNNLSPLSYSQLTNSVPYIWERILPYQGDFPTVKFVINLKGFQGVKALNCRWHDAKTGQALSTGYSMSSSESRASFQTEIRMWHAGPILFVFDLAIGPAATIEVEPKLNTRISHVGGELNLIGLFGQNYRNHSNRSDGKTNYCSFHFLEENAKHSTALFVVLPSARELLADFEFIGVDGKRLRGGGSGANGILKTVSVEASPENIGKIRIKQYPQVKRIIMHLDRIPGLPLENQDLSNLFDARSPLLCFDGDWRMKGYVEGTLQMKLQSTPFLNPPPGFFPRFYTNATPDIILADMIGWMPNQHQIVVDSATNEIRVNPPFWQKYLQRFRKLTGN